jgi:hypothetical protein
LLIAAVIITFSGMSVDAPPFTPIMPQPDYTSIMVEKSRNQEDAGRIVTHHGHWTRIDRTQGLSHTSEFYSVASGARMTVSGQRSITLERKIGSTPNIDLEARNTGERQTYLGESCTVWDQWRTRQPAYGSNVSHLSCITDDGITLWEKTLHGNDVLSSVEASRIERRPIAPEEVQAPRALLTLDWWDTDLPSFDSPSTPDHEAVMELSGASSGSAKSIRTIRRLGPWQFLDETVGSRRWILITHDSHQMQLQYISDPSGAPTRLAIIRPDIISASSTRKLVSKMTELNRSETILGESCRWFNMMPDVVDAGRQSCLTSDRIVLKEVLSGRPMIGEKEWTAVRLTRRPIRLDEIKPPTELLDLHLWGLD